MVRRLTPWLLVVLTFSVANPLHADPPAPTRPRDVVSAPKSSASRPVGIWVRDVGTVKVVLKLTDDRLTATAIFALGEDARPPVRVTLDADYAISKDGTLFGVVFGADATQPMYATVFQPLVGQPLAFGWRVDGDTLTVRNLKGFGSEFEELPLLGNGRYTRMDESKLPEWEKKLTGTGTPMMRTELGGMTAPPAKSVPSTPLFRHVPRTIEAPSPMNPQAHVVETPDILRIEVLKGVPKPAYKLEAFDVVCLQLADPVPMEPLEDSYTIDGDGTIDLGPSYGGRVKIMGLTIAQAKIAVEKSLVAAKVKDPRLTITVAQLRSIQQIGGQYLVRPDGTIGLGRYGNVSVSGKSLPDAKKAIEKHLSQYLVDPEVSVEVEGLENKNLAVVPAVSVVPAPVNPLHGTWLQDKDGMQLVLKFTEKRLHVEINAAFAVPGQQGPPVRLTQSMDADYSTSPDGTVFGILTGIDVKLGEGLPPEAYASLKEARREFEKMIGAMFKFRMRQDGGPMMLSEARTSLFDSVRGPSGDSKSDTGGVVGELFGGRFERVTGTIPPPKPTVGGFINQYSEDPNIRIEQLQKSKDELKQQGNSPAQPSTPAPKCKDCVPSIKMPPGGNEPAPSIPMSRS